MRSRHEFKRSSRLACAAAVMVARSVADWDIHNLDFDVEGSQLDDTALNTTRNGTGAQRFQSFRVYAPGASTPTVSR